VRILHLTDTHVPGPEGPHAEGIDGRTVPGETVYLVEAMSGVDVPDED
jgi:hypothetical protein